jgi:hypothetical protein
MPRNAFSPKQAAHYFSTEVYSYLIGMLNATSARVVDIGSISPLGASSTPRSSRLPPEAVSNIPKGENMVSQAPESPPGSLDKPPSEVVSPPLAPKPVASGRELTVLCCTLLSLFVIVFGVWLIFAWSGYGQRYSQMTDGWHTGGTYSIELTLVREDVNNLGCASDLVIDGLRCGHGANRQPVEPPPEDSVLLRPYNTVDSVLFLGAGLWSAPGMRGPLPATRFTAVCEFHMLGVIKSVETRWSPDGPFRPTSRSLPVGTLSGCVIPP